jgi:hypothetical protein
LVSGVAQGTETEAKKMLASSQDLSGRSQELRRAAGEFLATIRAA